jgi:hypothetical protein
MKKLLFMKFLFLILTCVLAGCSKTSGVRQGETGDGSVSCLSHLPEIPLFIPVTLLICLIERSSFCSFLL